MFSIDRDIEISQKIVPQTSLTKVIVYKMKQINEII